MKAFILTEGSSKIGFGHITRCLAIYQALQAEGIEAEMLVDGDKTINELLKDIRFKATGWKEYSDKTLELISNADIAVVDSYQATRSLIDRIADRVKTPVFLDDYIRLDYPYGIVLNGTIGAESWDYPDNPNISYLLGADYMLLRKPFWEDVEKNIRKKPEHILITFGGDDLRNMTPGVLQKLSENFPNINKEVIIGKGYKNTDAIWENADQNTRLWFYPDAEKMHSLMLSADFAISIAGQTLFELARCGTPAIAVTVADNQLKMEQSMKEHFGYAGWHEDPDILDNISLLTRKYYSYSLRYEASHALRKLVDGRGARRLVEFIINNG